VDADTDADPHTHSDALSYGDPYPPCAAHAHPHSGTYNSDYGNDNGDR
jgi:hypothetical protein